MIAPIVSGLVAQRIAANEGLTDSNKYLILGLALGSKPIGLGITLALANQEADQLPPPVVAQRANLTISGSLPNAFRNAAYNSSLSVAGGTQPFTWIVTSGQLPPGLSLGLNTGAITGTPTGSGSFLFMIQVSDKSGNKASQTFTISVGAPLTVATPALPGGTTGSPYAATLTATGGTQPYTWNVTKGSFAAGLNLDSNSGTISGTPTASGSFQVDVQVTDSNGSTASQTLTMTLNPPLNIVTALPEASVGDSYDESLAQVGGTAPFSWTVVSGSLPKGLTLDKDTGELTGTPSVTGPFNFTIQVTDSTGATASEDLTLTVSS
jgi:hypothetical protein